MLKVNNCSVYFHEGETLEKKVLDQLNLEVEAGEFVSLIGSNGSGKTTLFNAILGRNDYRGMILLDGKSLDKLSTRRRCQSIGIVYQDPLKGSALNLTVEENLLLAIPKGIRRRDYLKECKTKLSEYGLGIEDNFKTEVKNLSGGMRQGLALFMATLRQPKLLLLDEHTAALDPNASKTIMDITVKIAKENSGMAIIMIIHDLKLAIEYGNRLVLLKNGKIAIDVKNEEKRNLDEGQLLKAYAL